MSEPSHIPEFLTCSDISRLIEKPLATVWRHLQRLDIEPSAITRSRLKLYSPEAAAAILTSIQSRGQ